MRRILGHGMVTGIGVDIVEVARIRRAIARRGFVARVFTAAERDYCTRTGDSAIRFAGRFAAKEAVAKALGGALSWQDVEVLSDPAGRPMVRLSGRAAELAGGRRALVSISHCHAYAVAHAVFVAGAEPQ